MLIAGASSPCSPTSNRAGLASNRPISNIPTASPPELVEGLILVMSLALYWAVSTGIWDQVNNPTPAEKKTGTSARKARTRKALLVHACHPPRHKTPPRMPPSPETLGMPIKLMDAQDWPSHCASIRNHAGRGILVLPRSPRSFRQ